MKGETRRMEGEMSEILHANHGRDIEHAMSKKDNFQDDEDECERRGSRDIYVDI